MYLRVWLRADFGQNATQSRREPLRWLAPETNKGTIAIPIDIALTELTNDVGNSELSVVAAAPQKQVTHEFGPIWGMTATVDAFANDRIPVGYQPIIVQDTLDDPSALGYHTTRAHACPMLHYCTARHGC